MKPRTYATPAAVYTSDLVLRRVARESHDRRTVTHGRKTSAGVLPPSASCGRTLLKSMGHRSQSRCWTISQDSAAAIRLALPSDDRPTSALFRSRRQEPWYAADPVSAPSLDRGRGLPDHRCDLRRMREY